MTKRIRVAVVGGTFGEIHLQGFKHCPEFEVAATCRRQKELAEQTARNYEIERYYTDFDELIRQPDIDWSNPCKMARIPPLIFMMD